MKVYNTELQRLQEEMMEEKRLEAKLAELKRQQEELAEKTDELRRIMKDEQEDVDRLNSRKQEPYGILLQSDRKDGRKTVKRGAGSLCGSSQI